MKDKKYTFKKGSYIYVEGDEDVESVFILEKGEIQLTQINQNIPNYKNILSEGDIFGFISALSNHPRTESAVTLRDTSILMMGRDQFLNQLQDNSALAFKVINYFSEYLRSYDDMIFPGDYKEDSLPVETRLFNMGHYYYEADSYEMAYYILVKLMQLYPQNSRAEETRTCISNIESSGFRSITEPLREGIYNKYSDRQVIFCEDEPGDELFVIKEGKVKIVKYNHGTEILLSVLKEGDIFGEMALVSDKPRNATAVAYGNIILLPINRDSLTKLIKRSPQILKRIFSSISQRAWFTHIRLDAKTYKQPLTRIYVFLENKLLEENISLKTEMAYTLNFGIDELLKMVELSSEKNKSSMEVLMNDSNLHFNFGKITIAGIKTLSAKTQYYRSRDHISTEEDISSAQKNESNTRAKPKIFTEDTKSSSQNGESMSILDEMHELEDIPD
ncbi:MAG: hypothetical protein CVV44_00215 [Spirochaetae bacterium HGW-Spirochaetae-1]|jgi:CRP-like cAMP-binding protein|nr:MAG: hypothetical protein CVV44_00215 [Spirochaetae bacterium HGW-Spirochaetae-1]